MGLYPIPAQPPKRTGAKKSPQTVNPKAGGNEDCCSESEVSFTTIDLTSSDSESETHSTEAQPAPQQETPQADQDQASPSVRRLTQVVSAIRYLFYTLGPVFIPPAVAYSNTHGDFRATLDANGRSFSEADQMRFDKRHHFWAFTDYGTTILMVFTAYIYKFATDFAVVKLYPDLRKPNDSKDGRVLNFKKNAARVCLRLIRYALTIFGSATLMNAGRRLRLLDQLGQTIKGPELFKKLPLVWAKATLEEIPFYPLIKTISNSLSARIDDIVDKYGNGQWIQILRVHDIVHIAINIGVSVPLFMGLGVFSGVLEYMMRNESNDSRPSAPASIKDYFAFYQVIINIFAMLGVCYGALLNPLNELEKKLEGVFAKWLNEAEPTVGQEQQPPVMELV